MLTNFGEGNADVYSTYNEAKRTRVIIDIARRDIARVELGDELSADHKIRIDEAASTLSKSLFVKTEGLDLILKFLDNPKPIYINEATVNYYNRGYTYMIEGLSGL